MIAEPMKSYRGVSCIWYREPIAIAARGASLLHELQSEERHPLHAFIARCELCECENIYSVSEIQTHDGEPRRRSATVRVVGSAAQAPLVNRSGGYVFASPERLINIGRMKLAGEMPVMKNLRGAAAKSLANN